MSNELLSPAEMSEADRLTIAAGPADGIGLMRRAGGAVAAEVLKRYPSAKHIHVLCGPGNNGGDGYVVARILAGSGVGTSVWASGAPRPKSDAALAAAECPIKPRPLSDFDAKPGSIVIDALYGAGLSKPLSGDAAKAIDTVTALSLPVVAVDLPSGVSGRSGDILGRAFRAEVTITFARKKPGHLLLPGRGQCGEIVLADIGIGDGIIAQLAVSTFENAPGLWLQEFPVPAMDAHKYKRGHVGVFSGGPSATGAARLSALAAARSGAGAVTVLSPGNAMQVNATHLTSIMLREAGSLEEVQEFLTARHPEALVFGPGLGPKPKVGDFALQLIKVFADGARNEAAPSHAAIVLDADAITSLAHQPQALFEAARQPNAPALVITPHDGEFGRLFPDIAGDKSLSKLAKARTAAARANAVIVYKGADTVIAAPDGKAAINSNGAPWLATAGSGDVLSGIIAGLLAQGMPPFEGTCAAVWLHAEAGSRFGPGLIAEDLPLALVPVLRELFDARMAAQ
ncbi:bifunctional ADP-dependent NAD(P)H-hydrate dehydratase/NAD(P)H-hydrate epimerase [Mesorhizobium ciceri]|uniref:bifunctional ADP-dependent NAD(P)H-hydrate dehydratase/NAD(P)H-hydrate epimerase n=1 Tax=Mesorhizobium ciceri TaxID=39645 RepID=UPI0007A9574F|nr:bifunctional ADP-dependent NAD(P)H-hydrate dehydratase/NAD(P)H-hydrate epimerase [Mesorhizobium ciceri]AMY00602.1 bifunctional ADP-dependent (S)-NAD(P)H-hydrate dehydratase/NAD(P)H-hydrate epimerase [Mesorhizobium ciceri biovar biserrulae]